MASCTAMAYLGKSDWYDNGIQIMHMIRLYEGSGMDLCIERKTTWDRDGKMLGIFRCTSEHVLDDLMLLGAVYALEDAEVIRACREAGMPEDTIRERWQMLDVKGKLPRLYELSKAAYARNHASLVLVSLEISSMNRRMEDAKGYKVNLELCPSAYKRKEELA
ncbi:MAG: hypothetical protein PHP02_06805 [Eubacteriales bacterium]|nr:hypothetical protein [Eubacteriales bacterium]